MVKLLLVVLFTMAILGLMTFFWVKEMRRRRKGVNDSIPSDIVRHGKEEVFNVSRNVYSYSDAQALCKAYGARLATYDDVLDAYRNGAEWCNYGWSADQMALYPTSEDSWKELQRRAPPAHRNDCGKPGVNGGYFKDPHLRFGVNCFGKKPSQTAHNWDERVSPDYVSQEDFLENEKLKAFRREIDSIELLGFNRRKWSDTTFL